MEPAIRAKRDQAVFEAPKGRLRKYDVALYKRRNRRELLMHRVIKVLPEGYEIRGDNLRSSYLEYVPEENILGVMTEIYRGNRRFRAHSILSMLYCIFWQKYIRYLYMKAKGSRSIFWRGVRWIRRSFRKQGS